MNDWLPWIDGRDVTYLGRGRYRVECIWFIRTFVRDLAVELTGAGRSNQRLTKGKR